MEQATLKGSEDAHSLGKRDLFVLALSLTVLASNGVAFFHCLQRNPPIPFIEHRNPKNHFLNLHHHKKPRPPNLEDYDQKLKLN